MFRKNFLDDSTIASVILEMLQVVTIDERIVVFLTLIQYKVTFIETYFFGSHSLICGFPLGVRFRPERQTFCEIQSFNDSWCDNIYISANSGEGKFKNGEGKWIMITRLRPQKWKTENQENRAVYVLNKVKKNARQNNHNKSYKTHYAAA